MWIIRSLYKIFAFFGIDFKVLILTIIRLPRFFISFIQFTNKKKNDKFKVKNFYPCIHDVFDKSGIATGHYFYQDLYVAQKIFLNNPISHFDIGSRIDGFVTHVASFRNINLFDIRVLNDFNPNVKFHQLDLMKDLPNDFKNICDSLSCLHTLEHFGLGRYGDEIDPFGYIKGIENMTKILAISGILYFSVPIGSQRIEFNAHRVFSIKYLLELFLPNFELLEFAYVNDDGFLIIDAVLSEDNINNNFGCNYGCGIFTFKKL
ncbi:hypothetical protein GALL_109130 [mine drainage metagenome]|uniref:DUF268 domain-containing protein n=1 Tax=mine drainage metagenome TaxID=410659 RepID=A0A1J5T4C3_9ZZZZ